MPEPVRRPLIHGKGYPAFAQDLCPHGAVIVRPADHGTAGQLPLLPDAAHLLQKRLLFLFFMLILPQAKAVARLMYRLDLFVDPVVIFADHLQGGRNDPAVAPVILIQQNKRGLRIILPKLLHTVRTGAPEAIDGLVVIPHDKEIVLRRRQHFHDLILQRGNILKFIDKDILKLFLPPGKRIRLPGQQPVAQDHDVVEIHLSKFLLIAFIFF